MGWEPLPEDRSTTHSVQESLAALHRVLGLARPDALAQLEDAWTLLLGSHLAARARLESLHDGRLTVAVEDPAVGEALRWQAADLAAAADGLCGGGAVSEVVVRVRPGPARPA